MVTQRRGRVCQQVTEMRPNNEKKGSAVATVFINSPKHVTVMRKKRIIYKNLDRKIQERENEKVFFTADVRCM